MQSNVRREEIVDSGRQEKPLLIVSDCGVGLTGWRLIVKHAVDCALAIVGLILSLPFWALAALAIKLESKGPVLFAQERTGRDGKPFVMYKLRSMYEGAEEARHDLEWLNEAEGPVFKIKDDPRITKVGAFLRRSSLDEIPQLLNVLKGDMSLVGPRPPLPEEVLRYDKHQRERLVVRPGLTCLWQIQGRSNVPFAQWIELDLEYIRNQSLWLDFVILIKTIPAVFRGSGAW